MARIDTEINDFIDITFLIHSNIYDESTQTKYFPYNIHSNMKKYEAFYKKKRQRYMDKNRKKKQKRRPFV